MENTFCEIFSFRLDGQHGNANVKSLNNLKIKRLKVSEKTSPLEPEHTSRLKNCFFVECTLPKHQFKTRPSGSTLGMIYETLPYLAHTHTPTNTHTYSTMCGSDTIEALFWTDPRGS